MKSAYEYPHVKSVSAIALHYKGEYAGKIVANWSDNPSGSVCTATVSVWAGPLENMDKATGRAGGYGYEKLSAAVEDALDRATMPGEVRPLELCKVSGGSGNTVQAFEACGYTVYQII